MSTKSAAQQNKMQQASRQIILNYTPETWAEALVDCLQIILMS
jgi:hypothetical protein